MSYNNDPGRADVYTPPPPPAPRRSPWLYVGVGCGLVTLLTVGAIIFASMAFVNNIKTAMNQPINKAQVLLSLGDIPLYPGATFDEKITKAQRATFSMMQKVIPADSINTAAFSTSDSGDKIADWYDKKMEALGYTPSSGGNLTGMGSSSIVQQQYKKGQDLALVQVQRNPGDDKKNNLVLMRFVNIKGKI